MGYIEEVLGDLDSYRDKDGDFELLPDGSYAVVEVTEAPGLCNKNGDFYAKLVSVARVLPSGLSGNFGSPKFWDSANFITPGPIDSTLPDEEFKKARNKAGAWARRLGALGLNWRDYPEPSNEALTQFFAPVVGRTVIVKVKLEPAKGNYGVKNTVRDYYPDTSDARAKHHLTQTLGSSLDPAGLEL